MRAEDLTVFGAVDDDGHGITLPRVWVRPKRWLTPETSAGFEVIAFAEVVLADKNTMPYYRGFPQRTRNTMSLSAPFARTARLSFFAAFWLAVFLVTAAPGEAFGDTAAVTKGEWASFLQREPALLAAVAASVSCVGVVSVIANRAAFENAQFCAIYHAIARVF